MSFTKVKVTVTFDAVVHNWRIESKDHSIGYEMVHKIRVALGDSKDYLISTPCVETIMEKQCESN